MNHHLLLILLIGISLRPAYGLILFGADNQATTAHPGLTLGGVFDAAPWLSVGKVSLADDSGLAGSAVHLGHGWMITADHVSLAGNRGVVFGEGIGFYALDPTFNPQQIGTADVKIFRLQSTPNVPAVPIHTGPITTAPSLHIGWGVGRDATALQQATVGWGADSTSAHRWGLNNPAYFANLEYNYNSKTYTQTAIVTLAGSDTANGIYEAALTRYDSGSGLFQWIDGAWHLAGIGITVEVNNTSFFGTVNPADASPPRGHANYLASIPHLSTEIIAVIPEAASLLLALIPLACAATFRRRA